MGGSSSSNGISTKVTTYAPYIEAQHRTFLDTVTANRLALTGNNPFAGYVNIDAASAFFGLGVTLSSLPSIYETFSKSVLTLDLDAIWDNLFGRIMTREEAETSVAEKIKEIDERVIKETIPEFAVTMRNINAVCSSSFIVGRSVIEDSRVKQTMSVRLSAKESSAELLPGCFATELNSRSDTMKRYVTIIKEYFLWKTDTDDANYTAASRRVLWPFTVMSFEGAALGTMQGVASWRKSMDARTRSRSVVSQTLSVASYSFTGGYIGSSISPGLGTVIGAAIGFVVGIAIMMFE